ncbi:MAG: aminoacyl-tRNA hydrolase [Candidatus Amesbacteria bacterium]|nr:aminoacyl-tRNA hydrolase [Candidatus Amesbacteria bacterium]
MKIILGLGNPGVEYANTRHNAGVSFVGKLASLSVDQSSYGWRREKNKMVFKTDKFTLIKTATVFMNESGNLISKLDYLAHDDLDLKLGQYKIQKGVGPKVHNGVLSVENTLKTKDFWRIRIGIDNRTTPIDGETYVLQKFPPDERKILDGVFEKICNEFV